MSLADWANVAVIAGAMVVAYQVIQARRQLEHDGRPYVVVDLEPYGPRLDLVVRNSGRTAATDVHINIEPALHGDREASLREALEDLRNAGIPQLPPGRELRYFVAVVTPDFLERPEQPLAYTAVAEHAHPKSWVRRQGRRYRDITLIDIGHRKHAYLQAPPVEGLVQRLRDVTKALGSIERAIHELHRGEPDRSALSVDGSHESGSHPVSENRRDTVQPERR